MNKTNIISKLRIALPYVRGLVIGMLIPVGIFNMIDGHWYSNNTWQTSTGLFQILYAVALLQLKP